MENKLDFSLDSGDIAVVIISTLVTAIVGLYYGRRRKGAANEASYLGARNMSIVPITFSLIASFTSSFTVLVLPSEVIAYGTALSFSALSTVALGAWFSIYVIVPVMYNLDIYSIFDYFERRFDKKVKYFSTMIFISREVTFIAVLGLLPGIVLHQCIDATLLSISLVILSTISTTYGGFSGVVWTDTLQCLVMYLSLLILLFKSIAKAGGITEVLVKSYEGGRLNANFLELDPTARVSLWTYISFTIFSMKSVGGNQSMFQRIKALPSLKEAQRSCLWTCIGCNVYAVALLLGMAVYSYYDCDLLAIKVANSHVDTIVIFINETGKEVFSFRGWFLAYIICSTISTETTSVNTVGSTVYVDLIKPFYEIQEKYVVPIIRIMNMLAGLTASVCIWIFGESTAIFELMYSFSSAGIGVSAAHIFLGLFAVDCNASGALWGGALSYAITSAVSITNRWFILHGKLPADKMLDVRIEGCPANVTLNEISSPASGIPVIFRISPFCYILISSVLTIILSLMISWSTGGNKRRKLNRHLFSSHVYHYLKDSYNEEKEVEVGDVLLFNPCNLEMNEKSEIRKPQIHL